MKTSYIEKSRRWGLVPIRLVVGAGFLVHGLAKLNHGPEKFAKLLGIIGTPFPLTSAWMVTAAEVAGGIAILLGAFVVIASVPLIGTMLGAIVTVHWHNGFSAVNTVGLSASGPVFGPPGYEVNLLYIAALLALCIAGTSAASVDEWRERGRRGRTSRSRWTQSGELPRGRCRSKQGIGSAATP